MRYLLNCISLGAAAALVAFGFSAARDTQPPPRVQCIEKELLLQQADSELVRLQILRNKTARMLKEREVL